MFPSLIAEGKFREMPALTRRVTVAAGCCGYRSVRDSRSVSLSHPPRWGGGDPAPGLTHAPRRPPFVRPLFPLVISIVTAHARCASSSPRANIFPFCPLQNHPVVPSLFTSFLFRVLDDRHSNFSIHVCIFFLFLFFPPLFFSLFFFFLKKYSLFATCDYLIFESNFSWNGFRSVRFILNVTPKLF